MTPTTDIERAKTRLLAWNPLQELYHVTFEGRLSRIADEGLLPGQRHALGSSTPRAHMHGVIFLTGPDGVPFWYHIAEQWAHNEADDPVSEGWIPVVLRVTACHCEEDDLGTRDSGHSAFKCAEAIPPRWIELWDGEEWLPIEEYESLDPTLAVDDEGFMLPGRRNPLLPKPNEL